MILIAFFTEQGTPKTGLSATIDVWEDDGSQVVTAQAMTEIAGGFYKYNFSSYDESKDYCIRADGSNVLAANDRYVFSTNEIGQVTEDLTALDTLIDSIIAVTDNLPNSGALTTIIDHLTDMKGAGWTDENLKIIDSLVDAIKERTDNLPDDPADDSDIDGQLSTIEGKIDTAQADLNNPDQYKADVSNLDVAVSSRSSHNAAAIWAVGARTLTSFGTLITDIWNHAARTLTSFGTLIANIWTNATRTLTAGTKDTEIDAIKLETDKIAAVKTQTDKIPKLLALAFENYKLYDQSYDADGNLTSAKIRIYPTAADLEADTNKIAEYTIAATFAAGFCTLFKVKLA